MQNKNYIRLDMGNGGEIIKPTLALICQIEDELDSIPALLESFKTETWKISNVVTLIHMMLAESRVSYDYQELGNRIINDGVHKYQEQTVVFLELCMVGTTASAHKAMYCI